MWRSTALSSTSSTRARVRSWCSATVSPSSRSRGAGRCRRSPRPAIGCSPPTCADTGVAPRRRQSRTTTSSRCAAICAVCWMRVTSGPRSSSVTTGARSSCGSSRFSTPSASPPWRASAFRSCRGRRCRRSRSCAACRARISTSCASRSRGSPTQSWRKTCDERSR